MLENEIDKMLNNSDSADSHNHKRKSLGRGLGALLGEDDLDLDNVEDLSSLAPAPATANLEADQKPAYDRDGASGLQRGDYYQRRRGCEGDQSFHHGIKIRKRIILYR